VFGLMAIITEPLQFGKQNLVCQIAGSTGVDYKDDSLLGYHPDNEGSMHL
jgi:hypothetical protein